MLTRKQVEKFRRKELTMSGSLLVYAAEKLGYDYEILTDRVVHVAHNKRSFFFLGTHIPTNNVVSARLADNKYFTRILLKKNDIATPKTIVLTNKSSWRNVKKSRLHFPVVVKPISASHGNGASMHIRTTGELKKAVEKAFNYLKKSREGDRVLVEEFFTGLDLRLLVVGDKVLSIILREPAYVIGNGRCTVEGLINKFNEEWKCTSLKLKYELPMCPMQIDKEVYRYLKFTGHKLQEIPKKGERVQLRWNANVSTGGRTRDITDEVHENIKKIAIESTKLLKLSVAGVDILCHDIHSDDVSRKNVTVLEVNDSPGFDIHHFPYSGKGKEVTVDILKNIFEGK